jgi:dolichyl-phosphate beta-glucosyltransferase
MSRLPTESIFFSVVVPVFNEVKKIGIDISQMNEYFSGQDYTFEIVIVDDGSTDGTDKLLESLWPAVPVLRSLQHSPNRGKGYAARRGVLESKGQFVLLVDAGSCVSYPEVEKGFKLLSQGFDGAFGSRVMKQSKLIKKQRPFRRAGSWVFGKVARWILGINWIRDTQCGFKMFHGEAARQIFRENTIEGFMFDIETILNARKMGFRIIEFPIGWKNDPDSRFRPFFGSIRNIRELLKIKFGI